jgi:hypothetical protein
MKVSNLSMNKCQLTIFTDFTDLKSDEIDGFDDFVTFACLVSSISIDFYR